MGEDYTLSVFNAIYEKLFLPALSTFLSFRENLVVCVWFLGSYGVESRDF
jgi:hypothetical protein